MKIPYPFSVRDNTALHHPSVEQEFSLPCSRKRASVKGNHQAPSPQCSLPIAITIVLTAVLLIAANVVQAASPDESIAMRKPEATIDLATKEGADLVQGVWRYSDTSIIEVGFRAAGADGQPTGAPNKRYDFTPHAGGADFDDSKWEVID